MSAPLIQTSEAHYLKVVSDRDDLLEALKVALIALQDYEVKVDSEWGECRCLDQIEADGELPDSIRIVRAAIAKAEAKS